jgi:hypothetical protein
MKITLFGSSGKTGNSSVSRADVAAFMLNEAVAAPYIRKGVWLQGGK